MYELYLLSNTSDQFVLSAWSNGWDKEFTSGLYVLHIKSEDSVGDSLNWDWIEPPIGPYLSLEHAIKDYPSATLEGFN